jgi:putative phage-type endonuclease
MSERLKRLRKKVKDLQKCPQPPQRTPEWFLARNTRITASEVASCLFKSKKCCEAYVKEFNIPNFKYKESECLNSYESREDYIIKKCAAYFGENVFKDSVYTLWGKKYEEVANRLYCQLKDTTVIEFGLITHPRLKWIAASPDGITPDGVMLEIKCPKSRKLDSSAPPIYYWTQMQWQLETCNLDVCDYLECEIVELSDENEFLEYQTTEKQHKGIVLQDTANEATASVEKDPKYIYPPIDIKEPQQYLDWRNEMQTQEPNRYIPTYYLIKQYNIIAVHRNKEWFEDVKDDIKRTWDLVISLQKDKQDFEKYKDSIHRIKSKSFYDKYDITDCDIHDDDSTYVGVGVTFPTRPSLPATDTQGQTPEQTSPEQTSPQTPEQTSPGTPQNDDLSTPQSVEANIAGRLGRVGNVTPTVCLID